MCKLLYQNKQPRDLVMRFFLNTVFFALASASLAGVAAEHEAIPTVSGKPYFEARKQLQLEGWSPAPITRNPPLIISSNTHLSGLAGDMKSYGYYEISVCSDSGTEQCEFYFTDARKNVLKVTTLGGLDESTRQSPKVSAVSLVTSLPGDTTTGSIAQKSADAPQKIRYVNPDDCKTVRASPYVMVSFNGIDDQSELFKALINLIKNGNYTIEGYSVNDDHCYADITVSGEYNGNSYHRRLHSLLSGSM
ncbi:hypothetical protein ACET4Y_31065 [Pseudomonas aeruginosa]